jgi:N-acyl-D-amino-acid deacylase
MRLTHPLRLVAAIGALGAAGLIVPWLLQRARPPFEYVIEGGMLVDGTGGRPYRADVGVRRGRIAALGNLRWTKARQRVDASGLVVAPGFIDVHTHIEGSVPDNGRAHLWAPNFVLQGVTTLITGNCGTSKVPISRFLEQERAGWQLNVATFVGHNSIRRKVMEMAGRAPTSEELNRMRGLVEESMQEGALGLSTGLAYPPGSFADEDEVVALARVVARYGGIYVSHIRDEAAGGAKAIQEALNIGRRARLPVHISHFKASGRSQHHKANERLEMVRKAIEEGLQVTIDQYPYNYSSTSLELLFPPDQFADNQLRAIARTSSGRATILQGMLGRMRDNGWADLSYARIAWYTPDHTLDGLRIPDICRHNGKACFSAMEQAETALRLQLAGGAQMLYYDMDDQDVESIMQYEDTMVGTDSRIRQRDEPGKPHPRGFGTFPRILSQYVREKQLLTLPDAVRRMSGLPAQVFGLGDRGIIEVGRWADIVVFDPQQIHDNANELAPFAPPNGIPYVFVNGVPVLWQSSETTELPGKALRREPLLSAPSLARTLAPKKVSM